MFRDEEKTPGCCRAFFALICVANYLPGFIITVPVDFLLFVFEGVVVVVFVAVLVVLPGVVVPDG